MRNKCLLLLLLFISCSIHAIAQTYYYYNSGKKIPLTLNDSKVCVSIPKECDKTSARIRENVPAIAVIKDEDFETFIITRLDFEKLASMDSWEDDAKSVILTSCFFTELNDEVYSTPYLNVRLKSEQDTDLLASYAEKYKLKIVKNMSSMPLWYILNVTMNSEKSPLECANEMYESGDFASSVPDLASEFLADESSAIRSLAEIKLEKESSKIFDIQGRVVTCTPRPGIYIQQGRKYVVK